MVKIFKWEGHARLDRLFYGLTEILCGLTTVLSFGTIGLQNFEVSVWMARRTMKREAAEKRLDK